MDVMARRSIREVIRGALDPREDRALKEFYHKLGPRFRPGKITYVCRICGAGYWDRESQCTRCHSSTKKRRSWPWPAFEVVGPDRIRCGCGHTWRMRRKLNFNSQCPRCRGRLLVANPPDPARRDTSDARRTILRDEEWKGDWSGFGGKDPFAEYADGHPSSEERSTDAKIRSSKKG